MQLVELLWDDSNEVHIARHGVTSQEVLDVVFGDSAIFAIDDSHRRGSLLVFGMIRNGRHLLVVLDTPTSEGVAYVVTARPMTARERREYREGEK